MAATRIRRRIPDSIQNRVRSQAISGVGPFCSAELVEGHLEMLHLIDRNNDFRISVEEVEFALNNVDSEPWDLFDVAVALDVSEADCVLPPSERQRQLLITALGAVTGFGALTVER